ncbi:ucpB [Symbiodinium microadriaticum]|nr:ucpB [Symbiodinium microadriaticum]
MLLLSQSSLFLQSAAQCLLLLLLLLLLLEQEPVGSGRILDPAAPLVLRCIDRWTADVLSHFSQVSADCAEEMPMPVHMPSDRYLDGLDEETRAAVIRKYVPQEQFGGTAVISTPAECVDLMKKWEEVFTGPEFQCRRKALWDRRDLSFPARMRETRTMVAESLSKVLEPMGFAPGKPGLARCIKQMQVYWSTDKACADKVSQNLSWSYSIACSPWPARLGSADAPVVQPMPEVNGVRFARLWTLDGNEDDDNEFVWSPEIEELELKGSHLLSLFDGLDSRTTEVIVSAPNFGQAKSLLLAACQAAGAPTFCPEEVDATAVRVVADSLKSHIGREVCGHRASVSEELGCLMLTLRDCRRPFDEQFSSELAGLIEESLSSVSSLPTLGLDSSKPAVSAAARREAYASLGLAAGAAGTVVTGGSALVAVGFAAAAASLGAHAAMGQTDPTSPAVGCAFGRGTSRDLRVTSAAAMLRELLKTGVDLSLVDELTDEERVLGGHLAAVRVREAQVVASEDDTPPTLMAPLGLLVNNDNPLLTSMILAAMALITDSIAGAGEINGYVLRSVRALDLEELADVSLADLEHRVLHKLGFALIMPDASSAALQQVGLAGVSNAIAACFTNPVDVVKVRMQLAGVSQITSCNAQTVLGAGRKLWQQEGPAGLQRGLRPSILRELSYSGMRMGLYEPVRETLASRGGQQEKRQTTSPLVVKILAGAITGAIGSVIANPFDLLKVRMQGGGAHETRASVTEEFTSIVQGGGLRGLWRGAGPTVQRATLLTASQVPSYDHAKHTLLDLGLVREGYVCHFACSMLAGVVAAAVTSPVDLAKSRIMSQPLDPETRRGALYTNTLDCWRKTAGAEGIGALFRGFNMQWMRLGPHTTISLMCFEQLRYLAGMNFL